MARNNDQLNFVSAVEDALLERFGATNDRSVAWAAINSPSHRAVVYDLFRHYQLPYKRVRTGLFVKLAKAPCEGSEEGEDDRVCWECMDSRGVTNPLPHRGTRAIVVVELPPVSDREGGSRALPPRFAPEGLVCKGAPQWRVSPGHLKSFETPMPIQVTYEVAPQVDGRGRRTPKRYIRGRRTLLPHPLGHIVLDKGRAAGYLPYQEV